MSKEKAPNEELNQKQHPAKKILNRSSKMPNMEGDAELQANLDVSCHNGEKVSHDGEGLALSQWGKRCPSYPRKTSCWFFSRIEKARSQMIQNYDNIKNTFYHLGN
jgi:hypothetical protein